MGQRAPHHQTAVAAGLGELRGVYRVVRRIGYGLGVCLGIGGLILAGALGWTWWGCVLAAAVVAAVAAGYKVLPFGSGLRAVAHYEGGLVLAGANGYMPALAWDDIESCAYVPARHEYRGNLHTEHLAHVLLRVRHSEEPLMLTQLGGKEAQLARTIDRATLPRRTAPLHQAFAEHGRVEFGAALTVLPGGLLIGSSTYFRQEPLRWADLDLVGTGNASTVNLTATKDLAPGHRSAFFQVEDASAVAAFILDVCNTTLGLPPDGEVATPERS